MRARESGRCGCSGDPRRAGTHPSRRRAPWWAAIVDAGFGFLDLVGGFMASSRPTADALDFLGERLPAFDGGRSPARELRASR